MKKKTKIILIILIMAVVSGFLFIVGPICFLIGHTEYQMRKVGNYFDSITEENVPVWIERTEKYLQQYDLNSLNDPNSWGVGINILYGEHVPTDLKELGIIEIYIQEDSVEYIWIGGFEHTSLEIKKDGKRGFIFTAKYNNFKSKVIWPKEEELQE